MYIKMLNHIILQQLRKYIQELKCHDRKKNIFKNIKITRVNYIASFELVTHKLYCT